MSKKQWQDLPIIDISSLSIPGSDPEPVARQIHDACRQFGFFYIAGHGISRELQDDLLAKSVAFFNQSAEEKNVIRMELGGRAWRGYFSVGMELTSGTPDRKEGIYFGQHLDSEHPMVRKGIPLHGPNLYPEEPANFASTVEEYIEAVTNLGHSLMEAISLSLALPLSYFHDRYTSDPLVLFRIFHYPPIATRTEKQMPWGVGEHTDYGVLTILKQDQVGGLQVKCGEGWIDAPYIEDTFVCNIGDMLDLMTGGYYQSTPHRVLNKSGRDRYSFPLFFDPNFSAVMSPLPEIEKLSEDRTRWDGANLQAFRGTYGEYVMAKISKVFPDLFKSVH